MVKRLAVLLLVGQLGSLQAMDFFSDALGSAKKAVFGDDSKTGAEKAGAKAAGESHDPTTPTGGASKANYNKIIKGWVVETSSQERTAVIAALSRLKESSTGREKDRYRSLEDWAVKRNEELVEEKARKEAEDKTTSVEDPFFIGDIPQLEEDVVVGGAISNAGGAGNSAVNPVTITRSVEELAAETKAMAREAELQTLKKLEEEKAERDAQELKAQEEAERKAKQEESKRKEAERKKEQARIAQEAAKEKARLAEEKARKEKEARLARERAEAEEKARKDEDARLARERAEAEEKARKDEEARLARERAEAEEKARKDEDARLARERAEAEEKARKDEEARLARERAEAEEKARKDEEARLARERAEAEEKARKDEEARLARERAEAEEKARKDEEARLARERAEAEEKARKEKEAQELRAKEEAEAREKAIKAQAKITIGLAGDEFIDGNINDEQFAKVLDENSKATGIANIEELYNEFRNSLKSDADRAKFDELRPVFEDRGLPKLPAPETEEEKAIKAIRADRDAYIVAKDLSVASNALLAFGETLRKNWGKTGMDITALHNKLRGEVVGADQARFDNLRAAFESNGLDKLPGSGALGDNNSGQKGSPVIKGRDLIWYAKRVVPAAAVVGGALVYFLWQNKHQAKPKAKAAGPGR